MSDPQYHNAYKPPPPAPPVDVQKVISLKQEDYDVNFCFPSAVRVIENEWVKLVPYIVSGSSATLILSSDVLNV